MLAALVFVLARNIIKLIVERRRALPFARFRAKLVALLLGMTLVPALLVLVVGSELIRESVNQWFNAPMDEILSSANKIAGDYYQERQALVSDHASRLARALSASRSGGGRCPADSRSRRARRHAAARQDGAGVARRAGRRRPPARRVGRRCRGHRDAGRLRPCVGGAAGGAGAVRPRRHSVDRDARHLRRPAACRGRDQIEGRHADRRGGGDRLSDRRPGRAVALDDAGVRELQPAQGAQTAAHRRLPVVLPDGDAADPGRLDVDGPVPRPSGSPGRCRCWPPRRARSAPGGSISASSRRATTSSDRSSTPSTRWPESWPRAAARSIARRSSSSASTRRWKAGGGTSKPFSSGSRPGWSRSTPAAPSPRSTAPRRGCSG